MSQIQQRWNQGSRAKTPDTQFGKSATLYGVTLISLTVNKPKKQTNKLRTDHRRRQSQSAGTRRGIHWRCSWRSCWSCPRLRRPPAYSWSHLGPARPPGSARRLRARGTRGKSNPCEVAYRTGQGCWLLSALMGSFNTERREHTLTCRSTGCSDLTEWRHARAGRVLELTHRLDDLHRHSHCHQREKERERERQRWRHTKSKKTQRRLNLKITLKYSCVDILQ